MRRSIVALVTGLLIAGLPVVAQAVMLWSTTVTPSVATLGQSTTFTVTATNLGGGELACLNVDLPTYTVLAVGPPTSSGGGTWLSSFTTSAVTVHAFKDSDRVGSGKSVTFTITAVPNQAGLHAWPNLAHTKVDCSDNSLVGTPLPVTVLPAPTPTPVPTPVPTPTPTPTPIPSPTPTPVPSGISPTPTPTPSDSAANTPTPLESGFTSGAASPTPAPSTSGLPVRTPVPSQSAAPALSVAPFDDSTSWGGGVDLGMGIEVLRSLGDPFTWLVPGATVAGPGLLVLLFVALQALGALAWIPAVRRLGDEDDDPRRRRSRRRVSRGA